ncbi:uncharacterized protein HMPREF1541_08357 [Cyphellophora europaea CBS 101466]|uniref:Uncharacterized protein n=1 Tax=Cyphellophora europaea (strain CBS 101466) TaxID=1220924 RepID=W2RLK6_CYPE1|nr:uncharacterized protein HMPREF1541_08357 [Cyphellophora europaea CBS 101466]ETN37366.1 hypothetical protein HMPREF1541_08357 [Cyphellophora europaea CBS 101466]
MPSPQPPARGLRKEEIKKGYVLWLPIEARSLDKVAYDRSGLHIEACDHPVLVIDTLDPSHDLVWVLIMTSKYSSYHKRFPIPPHEWASGTIGIEKVYEVSLAMLRPERNEPGPGDYQFDGRAMEGVIEAASSALKSMAATSHALKICPRCPLLSCEKQTTPATDSKRITDHQDYGIKSATDGESLISTAASVSASTASSSAKLTDATMSQPKSAPSEALFSTITKLSEPATVANSHVTSSSLRKAPEVIAISENLTGAEKSLNSIASHSAGTTPKVVSINPQPRSSRDNMMDAKSALAALKAGARRFETKRSFMARTTGLPNHIKPGAILWNCPGLYKANDQPLLHRQDVKDRPCVVLFPSETTTLVYILIMTTFASKPLNEVQGISEAEKLNYLPVAKNGHAPSTDVLALHIAQGKMLPGNRTSYVNTNRIEAVPAHWLKVMNEGMRYLTAASHDVVVRITERVCARNAAVASLERCDVARPDCGKKEPQSKQQILAQTPSTPTSSDLRSQPSTSAWTTSVPAQVQVSATYNLATKLPAQTPSTPSRSAVTQSFVAQAAGSNKLNIESDEEVVFKGRNEIENNPRFCLCNRQQGM